MTKPGDRLRRLAARWCAPETMERLIEPIVADLQSEHRDAASRGGWRRNAVTWRGYLAFWKALALHGLTQIVRPSRSGSDISAGRVVTFSIVAFGLMTALMVAPPMVSFRWERVDGGVLDKLWLILLLVPQALPISLPTGICVGILCAMRGRRASVRHLATVLVIAAVATFGVWTMLEWGIPAGNQEFRETIATHLNGGQRVHLEPGLNELGLSRLAQRTDAKAIRAYRLLWAICFATPPFAVFALGIAALVRRFVPALVLGISTIGIYWLFLNAVDEPFRAGLAPTIVVWLPNITFLILGALMLRHGHSAFARLKPTH
jgi:lipopolysaccharide export LptBFGC system permease protein LptF